MDQITSNKDLSLLSNEGKLYSSTLKPIQVQLQKIYDECNTGYAGTIETSEVAADLSQVWGFSHLVSGAKALAKAFDDTEVVAASDEFNSANRRLNELCDLNGLPEAIESLGTELAEYEGIDSAAIEEKAKKTASSSRGPVFWPTNTNLKSTSLRSDSNIAKSQKRNKLPS